MSGTEALCVAVNEIVTVLDGAQKRRRQEDAINNIFNPQACADIDEFAGAGAADDLRSIVRNRIAAKARESGGNSSDDSGNGVTKL